MSVNVVDFDPSHLNRFDVQKLRTCIKSEMSKDYTVKFLKDYFKTLIVNGRVLGFGGLIPETEDVAQASVLLSDNIGHYMIHVHRQTKKFIEESGYRRVYMRCHVLFYESIIWAKMLGFEQEGVEREYVKGKDFIRFARIINDG